MSKAGFGDHLKREREMRGVSLDEICAATRISTRFLEALEGEHWEVLPGGVFNRGFVRAVSRYLGLDEEGMVAEYAMAMSEQNPVPAWSRPQAPPPAQEKNWLILALAVVVLLLAGTGWFGWRFIAHRRARQAAAREAAAATITATASSVAAVPSPPPPASSSSSNQDVSTPAVSATDTPAPTPAPTVDGSLELKIEASKPTRLAVEGDGLPLFNGDIAAGQNRTFFAQTNFQVSARDAGALMLALNGESLAAVGPAGKPGKVTLTRRDLKSAAGGTH